MDELEYWKAKAEYYAGTSKKNGELALTWKFRAKFMMFLWSVMIIFWLYFFVELLFLNAYA